MNITLSFKECNGYDTCLRKSILLIYPMGWVLNNLKKNQKRPSVAYCRKPDSVHGGMIFDNSQVTK